MPATSAATPATAPPPPPPTTPPPPGSAQNKTPPPPGAAAPAVGGAGGCGPHPRGARAAPPARPAFPRPDHRPSLGAWAASWWAFPIFLAGAALAPLLTAA